LDTTTIQDRTGLSQEQKEVIAVFNYLREVTEKVEPESSEVKHKKTGGNGQGMQH